MRRQASAPSTSLYRLYLGIADGMSVAWVWACRYSKCRRCRARADIEPPVLAVVQGRQERHISYGILVMAVVQGGQERPVLPLPASGQARRLSRQTRQVHPPAARPHACTHTGHARISHTHVHVHTSPARAHLRTRCCAPGSPQKCRTPNGVR